MKERQVKLIATLYSSYLSLVKKTSTFTVKGRENIFNNQILGYWHEDSLAMQLLLQEYKTSLKKIFVIVTADKRGDYIEAMINKSNKKAIRLPDGLKMRPYLNWLLEEGKQSGIIAASFDGPVGPIHEPKKLLFFMAKECEKEVLQVKVKYSKCLSLKWRWDNYHIPLPFTKIIVTVNKIGYIDKTNIKNYKTIVDI